MRRTVFSVLVVFVMCICFPMRAGARSLEEIEQTRELRVCLSPIHASVCTATPVGCREDCTFSGPAYEAAKAFADQLGKEVVPRFIRVGWDEQFFNRDGVTARDETYTPELLASGTCDVYPAYLAKNEWRLRKIDIVTLFPNRRMVIVKRSERGRYNSVKDLAGKVGTIEKNTSYHTWLLEQNKEIFAADPVNILVMPVDEGLRAVVDGRADFTIIDVDAAIWAVRNQVAETDMAFAVGPRDEIGWGFRKEDKGLQEAARLFFEQQRSDPNSRLNGIWKEASGMSLTDFIGLVSAIPEQ